MLHATARGAVGFAVFRFLLGMGEAPAVGLHDASRYGVVPGPGPSIGDRHMGIGHQRGRDGRSADRDLHHPAMGMAGRILNYWIARVSFGFWPG